jgi:hypothetical protein
MRVQRAEETCSKNVDSALARDYRPQKWVQREKLEQLVSIGMRSRKAIYFICCMLKVLQTPSYSNDAHRRPTMEKLHLCGSS